MFVPKKYKNILRYLVLCFFILISFSLVEPLHAQIDTGIAEVNESIALSSDDPRAVAARIINISMLVLGLLAVSLVLWGGFVWMTSNGEESKIDQAKKILKNGIIGLIIVLSAWGIATFILTRLIDATGNGGSSGNLCVEGQTIYCGCGGEMTCIGGSSWTSCIGSECGGEPGPIYCDSSTLPGCQAESEICAEDKFCDDSSCVCLPKGGLGDSCNLDTSNQTCEVDNDKCAQYLSCHPDTCTCYGPPVITNISPLGGFCENNINQTCQSDEDCATICNITVPNGAVDNLITINGFSFGPYDPLNSKVFFSDDVSGVEPSSLNPNCIDSWTDNQIIVAVPLGASSGPVQVITADGQIDLTNDENGPYLPDFEVNNIVRPGLCLLSPEEGLLSDQLNYQGFNLYSAEAYFGNYVQNVRGLDSVFLDAAGLSGIATVPNLNPGKMSSFVTASIGGNQEKSNYVNFNKELEPNSGPFISYFEPVTGRAGQYVTIYGNGFGGTRGFSEVYFGEIEADYDFPPVCAGSTWTDRQIIVKVPAELSNGAYQISIKLTGTEINSQNASPSTFMTDSNESLKTSICRISPSRGQVGSQVNIWGEYFGDIGGNALTVFTPNRSVNETIVSDQGAQRVNPLVPLDSASGPVKIVKGGEWGNVVNFEVGSCASNSECGGEICCPTGTYKQNQCVPTLGECYISIPNSVFEWGFATGFGGIETTTPYDSCQGMAAQLGACQVNAFCPNSPGLCSPFQGSIKTVGSCDASCNSVPACVNSPTGCTYDSQKDVCVLNSATCSLSSILEYELNGVSFSAPQTCQTFTEFGNQNHWVIKTPTSCPTGWTRLSGNRCVDSTSLTEASCSLCDSGFACDSTAGGTEGVCVSGNLCPTGASCSGSVCLQAESARCDCCCEIGQDARDCCAPLVCTGSCGADTADDGIGFGQCSGCAIPGAGGGFDISASDQACNCVNFSGKYCDTSVPTGVCNDCSSLSRDACLDHSQTCCLDSKGTSDINDDICVGGDGESISDDPTNPDFGYCAYYNCQDESGDPSLCASDEPQKIGLFRNIDFCGEACEVNPGQDFCSQHNGDLAACTAATDCCFNFSDNECVGGDSISLIDGHCAYYDCQSAPNDDGGQCNPSPSMVGDYSNFEDCAIGCAQLPPDGAGQSCRIATASISNECNSGLCTSPFACLNEEGAQGLAGDCGTCCCQVANPNSCTGLGNGDLVCQPNQTPCSGEGRGLCCGCSEDLDCGDGAVNLGCDSGTCCRARPGVIVANLMPPHGSDEICRNASLSIPFDQLMDVSSVRNNLILLEERDYGNGVCPSGTFIASISNNKQTNLNWFARITRRALLAIQSIFRADSFTASALEHTVPPGGKLYCSVPGSILVKHNGDGSVAEFRPKKLLSPATKYYLVVKGDENLDSNSGVLSQWQVGMNGEGYLDLVNDTYVGGSNISFNNLSFINSYISSFITLSDQGSTSGLCTVDYVKTEPASYLFNNTTNDSNEDDTNPLDNTFDTKLDKDKVFSVGAYSADGQLLGPTQGYYWDWDWEIMKPSVAAISNINGLPANQSFVSVVEGVTDDSTIMNTAINMDRFTLPGCNNNANCSCTEPNCLNNCCNVYEDGNSVNVNTPLSVFVCQNPWPAVNPSTLTWFPWYDNCEGAVGNCADYNYKFYYCRDAGGEGIGDDLPAMINPAVILGRSDSLTCSEGQTPCADLGGACGPDRNGDGVGDGLCMWDVLKESYFFQEATPSVGVITAAIDQSDGQRVKINWNGDSSLIYNSNPLLLGKYRIYYAPENTNSWFSVDVKPTDSDNGVISAQVCSPLNPTASQKYSCQKMIDGLQVDTSYVFRVSAISASQVESSLSSEKKVLVTDSMPPMQPQEFSVSVVNDQRFSFSWQPNNDDTSFYRLYHGVNPGLYGQSFDSNGQASSLELDLRQFSAGTHYFALSALDSSGNESPKSAPVSLAVGNIGPILD